MGILSREREAGQGIRRCGGLTRLPCIAHFAKQFISHLRNLRAACIGGQVVYKKGYFLNLRVGKLIHHDH